MFEEFINYYENKDLLEINENDIRIFLLSLVKRNVSHSYQNQSINAIKFYFEIVLGLPNRHYYIERPRKIEKLPVVLSTQEIQALIGVVDNLKHKAILMIIYSAGLTRIIHHFNDNKPYKIFMISNLIKNIAVL